MKKIVLSIILIFVILQLGLQIYLARADSQTTDEGVHLTAGYTYLTRYDFRFNPEHPSLVKMIAATPLLFIHPKLPADNLYWDKANNFFYDSWRENRKFGYEVFYNMGNNVEQMLFWGRLPMILISILLGLAIFFISYKLWGWAGGLVSFLLFILDPNFIAHTHLITTDIGVSLGYLAAVYCFWNFLQKPNRKNLVFSGISLGLAELAKFTAIVLYPAFLVLFIFYIIHQRLDRKVWLSYLPKMLLILLITWGVIWAGYGFKTTLAPETPSFLTTIKNVNYASQPGIEKKVDDLISSDKEIKTVSSGPVDKVYNFARYILIPRDYFKGLLMIITHVQGGQSSFLLGKLSYTGWWYYFPVLFALKTPIPTILLFLTAIYTFVLAKKRNFTATAYGLAALCFLLFAMTSKADLGIRHIFPIYPLLFVITGGLWTLKGKWTKYLVTVMIVWLAVETIFTFPTYLSYFNEFAGGSGNGYKIATDSNADWGQDLKRIKKYIDDNHMTNFAIEYYWESSAALDYYGVPHKSIDKLDPTKPRYLIIGTTAINGDDYKFLKNMKPFARITNSVFVYKLSN